MRRLRSGLIHGQAALPQRCREAAYPGIRVFLLPAVPAGMDSKSPAQDRGSGWRLHPDSSLGVGARRRNRSHPERDHRRLRPCRRGQAQRRQGVAWSVGRYGQHAKLRIVRCNRAHDRAHRLQPVTAFGMVADWRPGGTHADVSAAIGAALQPIAVARGAWRSGLFADGCRVLADGALLPAEPALGADAAFQRVVLRVGDFALGRQILGRTRWGVEGSYAGRVGSRLILKYFLPVDPDLWLRPGSCNG